MLYGRLNLTNFKDLKLESAFIVFWHTDGSSNSGLNSCMDPWPPKIHLSWRTGHLYKHSLEQMVPKSAIWHSSFVVQQPHNYHDEYQRKTQHKYTKFVHLHCLLCAHPENRSLIQSLTLMRLATRSTHVHDASRCVMYQCVYAHCTY